MKECSKSIPRRLANSNFINHYFCGHGLDIGGKPDPLALYAELFCRVKSIKTWDREDGDAQFLQSVADETYDFVHSSHCLEHLVDPKAGLHTWLRVVKPGGYLIITVPDEDLYEQGIFPSTFNKDHKWTFTIHKAQSWSKKSINILDLIRDLNAAAELVCLRNYSATYRFNLPRFDQTLTPVGECGIEFIIRKRPVAEINAGGRWVRSNQQPERELLLHLNQTKDDFQLMKKANENLPPFINETPL